MEEVRKKIEALRGNIKSKQITYNWHESLVSYMEAIFARGDRRLCDVLIKALKKVLDLMVGINTLILIYGKKPWKNVM